MHQQSVPIGVKVVRNERYGTPKRKRNSPALEKATVYAIKDNKSTRVQAKQAILQELNSHLVVTAQRLHSQKGENRPKENESMQEQTPHKALVSTKRERKRLNVEGTVKRRSDRKENVDDYTWNNKGRLDELRIRYLARKYLHVWKRTTFGRVCPAKARGHYNNNLKQWVLREWQEIWWNSRKGWKLNIRAEYHNRFRLWQMTFKSWRQYVIHRRELKQKENCAIEHAELNLKQDCWLSWTQYVEERRRKRILKEKADRMALNNITRNCWMAWKQQMDLKYELVAMETEALQHWAFTTTNKAWMKWMGQMKVKEDYHSKMSLAVSYSNNKLTLRFWRGIKLYWAARKLKCLQKETAERFYKKGARRNSFRIWKKRFQRKMEIAKFDDLVDQTGRQATVRRYFEHWKHYIYLRRVTEENQEAAVDHHRKHKLRMVFKALHLHAVKQRVKELREIQADQLSNTFYLRRVWNIWLQRCEHSEELKLYSQTKKARQHHGKCLLKKCISGWKQYVQWRQHRNIQYTRADLHYQQAALPRFLDRMKLFVELMKDRHEMKEDAIKFRREVLTGRAFYTWVNKYQLMMDVAMMHRMAILHHDELVKKHFFQDWRNKTHILLKDKHQEETAEDHIEFKLMHNAISTWKQFVRDSKARRQYLEKAVKHDHASLQKKCWVAWTQFVTNKQRKWQKQAKADVRYNHHILKKTLNGWKVYHCRAREIHSEVAAKVTHYNGQCLRWSFSLWHENVKEQIKEKESKHLAILHWKNSTLRKVLNNWREYSTLHRQYTEQKQTEMLELKHRLRRGKLFRAFKAWKKYTHRTKHDDDLNNRADQHYKITLQSKSLQAWKSFTHLCFRKVILQRQAMWFHNKRISKTFLQLWIKQNNLSLESKKNSTLALWYWSLMLQRKVICSWVEFAISKKRKKQRISEAIERRRHRLLQQGVVQWLEVSSHLSGIRSRFAASRQVEMARSVYQTVHRCAMHWRQWTAKQIRIRGGQPKPQAPPHKHQIEPVSVTAPMSKAPLRGPDMQIWERLERALPSADSTKHRPKPRKPEYLRESFDISNLRKSGDFQTMYTPVKTAPSLEHPSRGLHRQLVTTLEALPRPPPPPPSSLPALGQNGALTDLTFLPSSEGEDGSPVRLQDHIIGDLQPKVSFQSPVRAPVSSFQHNRPNIQSLPCRGLLPNKPVDSSKSQNIRHVLLPPSTFMTQRKEDDTVDHDEGTIDLDERKEACDTGRGECDEKDERHDLDSESCKTPLRSPSSSIPLSTPPSTVRGDSPLFSSPEMEEQRQTEEEPGISLLINPGLHVQIMTMKESLQTYHDVKTRYKTLVRQQKHLHDWVTDEKNEQDSELKEAKQHLIEMNEEIQSLKQKLDTEQPQMHQLANQINNLLTRIGLS